MGKIFGSGAPKPQPIPPVPPSPPPPGQVAEDVKTKKGSKEKRRSTGKSSLVIRRNTIGRVGGSGSGLKI